MSTTSQTAFVVEEWTETHKGSRVGHARVRVKGLVFHDVAVNLSHGAYWASPSSKARVRDGRQMLDRDGKGLWSPVVTFASKELRDQFSANVVEAIRAAYPGALPDKGQVQS
jgi:hypothetical protein